MMTTLVGLKAGYGILMAMKQAAVASILPLASWAVFRLLTRRDTGLVLFVTTVWAAVFEPVVSGQPTSPLVMFGFQGPMGLLLMSALYVVIRLKPEEDLLLEPSPEGLKQPGSPLWDSDLDQLTRSPVSVSRETLQSVNHS
jgi:hypothetical protein